MNAIARILRRRRAEAGALQLASPEVKFEIDTETHDPLDVGMYQVQSLTHAPRARSRQIARQRQWYSWRAPEQGTPLDFQVQLAWPGGLAEQRSRSAVVFLPEAIFSCAVRWTGLSHHASPSLSAIIRNPLRMLVDLAQTSVKTALHAVGVLHDVLDIDVMTCVLQSQRGVAL